MKNKAYIFILGFILLLSGLSDIQADPFVWGCIPNPSSGNICIEGYLNADNAYLLCSGDTLILFATNSDDPATTYQWYESYTRYACQGCPPKIYNDSIEGATNHELVITETTQSRVYWCKVTVLLNSPYLTGEVQALWSTSAPVISQDLSNESCCKNTELGLKFFASGDNLYTWEKKSNLPGAWWKIALKEYSFTTYKLTPQAIDHLSQIKCTATNGCGKITSSISTLSVLETPDLDLGEDRHICESTELILDAGSGMTYYNWSTGDKSQTFSVVASGIYWVTITNPNTCKSSDTVEITIDPNIPTLNMPGELRACQGKTVSLDAGDAYDTYLWNTGASTRILNVTSSGEYSVEVSKNNNVCIENDTINVIIAEPYTDEKICIVTVDLGTGKNMVVWEQTPDKGIQSYNVYREDELIGTVHYNELSIFKDSIADPETRPYLYYISVVDTCGNESDKSPYHKPLFLQFVSSEDGVNLRWSNYAIENGKLTFDNYSIYRGSESLSLAPFAEYIPTIVDVYTDNDSTALLQQYYYRVAGILSEPCYPSGAGKAGTGPYTHSLSNMDDNKLRETGDDDLLVYPENDMLIFPNPFSHSTRITFPSQTRDSYIMVLTDLSGKVCRIVNNISTSEYTLMRGNLKNGLYLIELIGPTTFRGKLLIE